MKAQIIPEGEEALALAAELIRREMPVAAATETVYGLAADATSGRAVARIYEAKDRPRFNPLIVHVDSLEMARTIGVFDLVSYTLAKTFWPGPLTVVVPLRPEAGISELATAGLETVGLRMPKGFAAHLVTASGKPLAAPSANASGRISATSAQAVAADLGSRIPLIVDSGSCGVGVESTIVRAEAGQVVLLRPGGLPADEIEAVAGVPLVRHADSSGQPQAPGMLVSHYAPRAGIRLAAQEVLPSEALLAFGPASISGAGEAVAMRNLSERGDLSEAAANLFAFLAELDRSGARTIACMAVPRSGLGEAINDRLSRAAAPRP